MCRWGFLTAVAGALACVGGAGASPSLPPLPARWPHTLQLGLADEPGDAAALRKVAPFGFRYQYLAGGVNTGQGWSTWNPNGSFVTRYDEESWAAGEIPVFSYYMLLQSKPVGGDEAQVDLAHLRDPALMRSYWADVRLFFQRAHGTKTVVLHVEPDLWGYLEQANAVALASSFAQQFVRLRNELAPNVLLAYHMSGWGTRHDIAYDDPPNATVRAYAAQSAAARTAPRARATRRRTASPSPSRSTATRCPRSRPTTTAATSKRRRRRTTGPES